MRAPIRAASLGLFLAGCQLPRPLPQQAVGNCPLPLESPPRPGSTLFITLRLPDCAEGGTVRRLSDLRAPVPQYAGLINGQIAIYRQSAWISGLEGQAGPDDQLVLFVHGYRVSNEEALETASKIKTAIRTNSPVVALTWPSYGKYTDYLWDEANAEWASQAEETALLAIASRFPHVVIIAHSMGNRLALSAMNLLRQHGLASHVDHLIMASPDVDRSTLKGLFADGVGAKTTVYGSRRDQALSVSWRIHGYPRGGDLSWWVTGRDRDYSLAWLKDVEVVDTTEIDHSLDGHSAFIDTPEGADDLCRVIRGEGPKKRALEQLSAPTNYYRLVQSSIDDECGHLLR